MFESMAVILLRFKHQTSNFGRIWFSWKFTICQKSSPNPPRILQESSNKPAPATAGLLAAPCWTAFGGGVSGTSGPGCQQNGNWPTKQGHQRPSKTSAYHAIRLGRKKKCWISIRLRENLNRKPWFLHVFTIKYGGFRLKFSLKPIHWN